jgi:hypothetical protein
VLLAMLCWARKAIANQTEKERKKNKINYAKERYDTYVNPKRPYNELYEAPKFKYIDFRNNNIGKIKKSTHKRNSNSDIKQKKEIVYEVACEYTYEIECRNKFEKLAFLSEDINSIENKDVELIKFDSTSIENTCLPYGKNELTNLIGQKSYENLVGHDSGPEIVD